MHEIEIYKREIEDGVSDSVKSQSSIAYCSKAVLNDVKDGTHQDDFIKKIIAENKAQIDLYYLESVLVSTGWNKNDDVFLSDETWSARNTPEDKQFNFMHDENDIIGHITGSYVLGSDGNKILSNQADIPKDFDIITQAVLYNSWHSPENKERMENIIAEIKGGKWFVSMECLFTGFYHAVIDKNNKSNLVARDETSAFLTKHLRAYGGTGEYEGYKVGRALRNISFSGKGLVSHPANPRSVILSSKSVAFNNNNSISIGDLDMADSTMLEQQLADLKAELASAKVENSAIKAQIEEAKDKEFSLKVDAFETEAKEKDSSIFELTEKVVSLETTVKEHKEQLVKAKEDLTASEAEISEMKKIQKQVSRKAALIAAGFDGEEVDVALSSFDDLSDEAFDNIVSLYANKKEGYPGDKDKDKDKDKKKKTDTEASLEATDEIFDDVSSTEATLVVNETTEEDEVDSVRASISDWFSTHVLNK